MTIIVGHLLGQAPRLGQDKQDTDPLLEASQRPPRQWEVRELVDRGVLRRHTHRVYGGTEGPVLRLLPFWCPTEAAPIRFCSGQFENAPMLEGFQGEGTGSGKL